MALAARSFPPGRVAEDRGEWPELLLYSGHPLLPNFRWERRTPNANATAVGRAGMLGKVSVTKS
jgi:hypothetical protein